MQKISPLWLLLTLSACANWPVFSHLEEDGAVWDASTSPSSLVDISWTDVTELEDWSESPVDLDPLPWAAAAGAGVRVSGTLVGAGWRTYFPWESWQQNGCVSDAWDQGYSEELLGGYYGEDVDTAVIEVQAAGVLCASVVLPGASAGEVGVDLLLYALEDDPCNPPTGLVEVEGQDGMVPWGTDIGQRASWQHPVALGDRFAVQLGAYAAPDGAEELPYILGLSLVASTPGADAVWCPLLASEDPS
ncbi:MAG: hypothetical protein JXX28_15645 [Deltaproteobacteria bacterium]|nr:hypothetical protein [Deltaproteobacteria bacterium]